MGLRRRGGPERRRARAAVAVEREWGKKKKEKRKKFTYTWVPQKSLQNNPNEIFYALSYHVGTDTGVCLSEIVLVGLNQIISAHWNKFTQNR
jgi:hypothetical protein